MIKTIIDLFYNLARQHKGLESFFYNRTYEIGSGNDRYPLLWLEDPIYVTNHGKYFSSNINFSVLYVPNHNEDPAIYQNKAFKVGLSVIEKIKTDSNRIAVEDWDATTLRKYYDDNSSGCRFSLRLQLPNSIDLCELENDFDKDKELTHSNYLPEIDLDNPDQNCIPLQKNNL